MSEDLAAFLLARLDEDERVASEARSGPWVIERFRNGERIIQELATADGYRIAMIDAMDYATHGSALRNEDADHIARHDPARVLADVAAKRRIVEAYVEHRGLVGYAVTVEDGLLMGQSRGLECAVRFLALPWAEHEDYRAEWKP